MAISFTNHGKDAISVKGSQERCDFLWKDCAKGTKFLKGLQKKVLFLLKDHKKDSISVKRMWKKTWFLSWNLCWRSCDFVKRSQKGCYFHQGIVKKMQSLSKYHQNHASFIIESRNRCDHCKNIEKGTWFSSNDCRKRSTISVKGLRERLFSSKDCRKKWDFFSKDCGKDVISIKRSQKRFNFQQKIVEKKTIFVERSPKNCDLSQRIVKNKRRYFHQMIAKKNAISMRIDKMTWSPSTNHELDMISVKKDFEKRHKSIAK